MWIWRNTDHGCNNIVATPWRRLSIFCCFCFSFLFLLLRWHITTTTTMSTAAVLMRLPFRTLRASLFLYCLLSTYYFSLLSRSCSLSFVSLTGPLNTPSSLSISFSISLLHHPQLSLLSFIVSLFLPSPFTLSRSVFISAFSLSCLVLFISFLPELQAKSNRKCTKSECLYYFAEGITKLLNKVVCCVLGRLT